MSVINRMLRDLDQRQQQQSKGSYTPAAVAPQPLHWTWMIGIAVGTAVVIIVLLNIYWWLTTDTDTVVQTVEAPVTNQPTVVPAAAEEPTNPVDEKAETESETASKPALQRGPVKPRELVQIPASSSESAATELEEVAAEAEPAVSDDTLSQRAVAVELEPEAEVEAPDDTPSTFAVERVQLSPNELAETNLQKARSALRRGEREQGQELLEKALTVMPEHVAVRSELAAYWYGRGFATRAVAILQQGLDRVPQQSQWQLLLGRILERMGRIEDAYIALQSLDSSTAEYSDLLEVRGNSANQLGYFTEAAQDFLALANLNGEGRWWLAAAVAFEDAGEPAAALRAYQQAAFARDLGVDARRYAEDRLQALGGS
ncbi:tetratricopeptide repeat protein [Pseudidiomarina aestuarii]|uniref:tetratricopeptide repeat protein n=1 Tax=Pseudidiomarina aestuarii TaxID=624146 RepID=UPI003A9761F6